MRDSGRTAAHLRALLAQPIAHRGLHACGAVGPVENSIGAARAAIGSGYAIECDVQISRDGEAMVFHDADLGRLTGSRGPLVEREAATLQHERLRDTQDRIPTLTQFLTAIAGRVPVVVEIKSQGEIALTKRVLEVVRSYDGALALESFDPAVVAHCRASDTDHPVGFVGPSETPDAGDRVAWEAADFLSWSVDHLTDIQRIPPLPLTTWTVRTAAQLATAKRHNAQIVFEGFDASPAFNYAG